VRGLASLGLRFALPIAGAYLFDAIARRNEDPRCRAGNIDYCPDDDFNVAAVLGVVVGAAAAMVIDAAVVARPRVQHRRVGVSWMPRISMGHDQLGLGVVGRF